jgi:hypothetical protein
MMVRAEAVVDKIAEVSAYIGEGLGQVMGLFGEISQVVILKLIPRELLVLAQQMTI